MNERLLMQWGLPAVALCLLLMPAARAASGEMTVQSVQGSAWVRHDGRFLALRAGHTIVPDDPVELGSRSRLRTVVEGHGVLEFGSHAQFALRSATHVALQKGVLHIDWKPTSVDAAPLDVDIAGWSVQSAAGVAVIDAAERRSVSCLIEGDWRLSPAGATATGSSIGAGHCAQVVAGNAQAEVSPAGALLDASTAAYSAGRLLQAWRPPAKAVAVVPAPTTASPVQMVAPPAPAVVSTATKAVPEPPRADLPAAQVATVVPVPVPEPPAPPSGSWIVNVTSFSQREHGQALVRDLQGRGYAATLRSEIVHGLPSYRTVVDGYPSEQEADAAAQELAARYGLASAWVMRTR